MAAKNGAGSIAALTAAAAARLIADVARETSGWKGSAGVVAQATALAERCEALAVEDAEAFTAALDALTNNSPDLVDRMVTATAVPVEIAVVAADVAEAAVVVAERCDGLLRADAAGAAALAAGAASAAAHLVRANLTVTADDPRLKRAEIAVDDARYSASRALDSGT